VLYVQVIDDDQNVTLNHNLGATQRIMMHQGAHETLNSEFGGWVLIFDGTHWYDCSHAKHV
ncbi:unnamed protein product, partial [marine sediment metagenome]